MLELEKVYLARSMPPGLAACSCREILDIYIPADLEHPALRLRKDGDRYHMTKKIIPDQGDKTKRIEYTIPLSEQEFNALAAVDGKRLRKLRYAYQYNGRIAEVDVFQDALLGLVLIDFEFSDEKALAAFRMPDFCLAEITQSGLLAGGLLCGKSFSDISGDLRKFGYKKI